MHSAVLDARRLKWRNSADTRAFVSPFDNAPASNNSQGASLFSRATQRMPTVVDNASFISLDHKMSAYGYGNRRRRFVKCIRMLAGTSVHQIPGTSRFVFVMYVAYSSPNSSSIILSSSRIRNAKRIPNVTRYDGPAIQFGRTSTWPSE